MATLFNDVKYNLRSLIRFDAEQIYTDEILACVFEKLVAIGLQGVS